MAQYTIKQVADMAGVSVKTLRHYEKINLLMPSFRNDNGYRYYEDKELLQLQQILFYK
jgi:DNA-binding transcriptional MerR regulator